MANYAGWFNSAVNNGLVRGIDPSSPEFAAAQAQGNQYNSQFAYNGHNSIMPVAPGQGGGYSQGYGGNMGYGGYGGIGYGNVNLNGLGLGGGGGYGNNQLAMAMFQAGQDQYNTARNANLDRYNMILGGMATTPLSQPTGGNPANFTQDQLQRNAQIYGTNGGYQGLYQRGMSYLQGQGTAQKALINEQYNNLNQSQQQNLTDRGLSNSTVLSNAQNAVERERGQSLQSLNESLNRQYLNTDTNLTDQTLGFMERRQDNYPNVNSLTSLAYQAGRGGGGGYGGGMSPMGGSSSMYYRNSPGVNWTPGQLQAAYNSNRGAGSYSMYGGV